MDSWSQRLNSESSEREAALAELRPILLRGLRAGLSGRAGSDEAFLEDIAQVTLIRINERLDAFEGRSKFTSWALAIALRLAFNELRRKEWKNVSLEELKNQQAALPEEADRASGADEEMDRRQLAQELREIIQSDLTSRQRDVLLCELKGMPQEEIARELGTNRNNVYKIFHDARKALKKALESRGFDRAHFFDSDSTPPMTTL